MPVLPWTMDPRVKREDDNCEKKGTFNFLQFRHARA